MDNNSEAALTMLTAFIGAVFGCIGCFAAMFTGDTVFGMLAMIGGTLCAALWFCLMTDSTTDGTVYVIADPDEFETRLTLPAAADITPEPALMSSREPS